MKERIFIPTRGRIGNQLTYDFLTKDVIEKYDVTLVCPKDELRKHLMLGYNAISSPIEGITKKRQIIMEYAQAMKIDRVMMIDDDLDKWAIRIDNNHWKLRPAKKKEVEFIIRNIFDLLDKYPLAGISERFGNNRLFPAIVKECTRQTQVHALDVKKFFEIGARFDRLDLMEDFDVTLWFLTHGYKNAKLVTCTADSFRQNKGGCKIYRTNELQNKAARQLRNLYKDFVTLVTKKSKSGWEGMATRTDVRVQWAKAYESSKKNRK